MNRSKWVAAAALVLALGCSKSAENGGTAAGPQLDTAARQAEWTWLEGAKRELDRQREELASLREQAAGGSAVGPQIEATDAEISRQSTELNRRLADFINADPPVLGEPMRPDQAKAIRLKSGEDMVIANEFIELGGDYRKAIDIYTAAATIDPDNPELKAALADAEAKRFMTVERFALVKKKMTEAQVIAAIGRPLQRNIRDYPEKKVKAWFYPKNEEGEAAGVFLTEKGEVYSTDFEAVKKAGAGDQG
jgi:hypothetical protein